MYLSGLAAQLRRAGLCLTPKMGNKSGPLFCDREGYQYSADKEGMVMMVVGWEPQVLGTSCTSVCDPPLPQIGRVVAVGVLPPELQMEWRLILPVPCSMPEQTDGRKESKSARKQPATDRRRLAMNRPQSAVNPTPPPPLLKRIPGGGGGDETVDEGHEGPGLKS